MYIERLLQKDIEEKLLKTSKGIILYGPRQVGKTTLLKKNIEHLKLKTLFINADQYKNVNIFSSGDFEKMNKVVSGYELLVIDEAQRIPNVGINLKILFDNLPNLKIIATGSSSFELADKVHEPLTGRVWNLKLFPISTEELLINANQYEVEEKLEERLIYGSYPEIFSFESHSLKYEFLENLYNSYIYKDIFELATIKNPKKLRDLLKLLAYQIGNEVSINELSRTLEISKATVEHYIDLLEKSFVIFRLSGFSRNLRKEVTKMDKIYFYDLGVRNIAVDNCKELKDRDDIGKLWENFLIVERMKTLGYNKAYPSKYFWRTYTGAELDYIEEHGGNLSGFEFKWKNKKVRPPKTWLETYKNSSYKLIHKENYMDFIVSQNNII